MTEKVIMKLIKMSNLFAMKMNPLVRKIVLGMIISKATQSLIKINIQQLKAIHPKFLLTKNTKIIKKATK